MIKGDNIINKVLINQRIHALKEIKNSINELLNGSVEDEKKVKKTSIKN